MAVPRQQTSMKGDFHLGGWLVQPNLGRISKDGRSAYLRPKVMDLLVYLARHPGDVISKDTLLTDVWGTEAISESALTRTVTELRQALGDDVDDPRLLETIPKRGYRLIAPVSAVAAPGAEVGVRRFVPRVLLTSVVAAISLAAALAVGVIMFRSSRLSARVPVVAVLPFDSASSGSVDQYLVDGMQQEIISRLGMIGGIDVIDWQSTMRYRDRSVPIRTIAKDLGADFVLRATLSKHATRIRFVPVLTDARDDDDQWTDQFDRDLSVANLVAIQSEIAVRVAEQLRVKISSAERGRISGRRTENATAYSLFLRGAQLPSSSADREEFLKQAIALDPGFAAALAELAYTYVARSYTLGQSGDLADKGILHARRAIQLDPMLPAGYRALGLGLLDKGHLGAAAGAYRQAVDLQPSDGDAVLVLGWIDYLRGRLVDAVDRWMAARTLSPFSATVYVDLSSAERLFGNKEQAEYWRTIAQKLGRGQMPGVRALMMDGKIEEARARARAVLSADPESMQGLNLLAEASIHAQDYETARNCLARLAEVTKEDWNPWGLTYRTWHGYVLLQLGEYDAGSRLLDRTLQDALTRVENGDERPGVKREIAAIHAARGEPAEAYKWFRLAIASGWRLERLHPSPLFASLHREPEFQRLVQLIDEDVRQANMEIERRGVRRVAAGQ